MRLELTGFIKVSGLVLRTEFYINPKEEERNEADSAMFR